MTRADIAGGLLLAALFGAALWEGWSFQYGTEFAPGPGFAPVWLSGLGLAVSLLIAFIAFNSLRRPEPATQESGPKEGLDKPGLLRVGLTLVGLVAMLSITPWLGLVSSILLFLLFLTLVVQRLSVPVGIGASVVTVLFVYVVFIRLLDVPIPSGPLGF